MTRIVELSFKAKINAADAASLKAAIRSIRENFYMEEWCAGVHTFDFTTTRPKARTDLAPVEAK